MWRTELVTVEKVLDELWIGVKGQSNLEISCSLRNNFRVSLGQKICRGRALGFVSASYDSSALLTLALASASERPSFNLAL